MPSDPLHPATHMVPAIDVRRGDTIAVRVDTPDGPMTVGATVTRRSHHPSDVSRVKITARTAVHRTMAGFKHEHRYPVDQLVKVFVSDDEETPDAD